MAEQIKASITRVFTPNGAVAGSGFLVSDQHVLTCAHVVAQALGIREDSPETPASELAVDFPLVAPGTTLRARVVCWQPVQPSTASPDAPEDIAVLELKGEVPDGIRPGRLVAAEDVWGHAFRAFGFPVNYDAGVWASGVLRAPQTSGWVQIEDVKSTGYVVAPGFSGTPVWDDQVDGVVGIVVVAERRAEVKAAFIIPSSKLVEAWPPLGRQAIPPCPYRGLFAFREQDASFFRGREKFTDQLVEAVAKRPMVAVIGPSGSGKSSVVFAGLVPCLRREGGWLIASFRPGDRPFAALAAALVPLLELEMSETDRLIESRKLAEALERGELALAEVATRALEQNSAERFLLVADQFEELYTLCREAPQRQRFIDRLLEAVEPERGARLSALNLVTTMRADFFGQALSYRPLADALQNADLKLGPMTREELQAAIESPAQQLGVKIEDGLTERILQAVSEGPGDPPLLQFALTLLWGKQSNGKLTHAAYDEIGGVERALAGYAEEVYGGLDDEQRQRAQRVFLQLVRPGEGTEDTRRQATRGEVGEHNWDLVSHLASGRLVVSSRDEAKGTETVEIVHEALIANWEQLRQWMGAGRAFRTWQERLRAALRQWEASNKDEGALLRGAPLAEAQHWLEERGADLSQAEREYIESGLALRRKEREREARERWRWRFTLGLTTAFVTACLLIVMVVVQYQRGEEQRQAALAARSEAEELLEVARSRQLAARALAYLGNRFDLALLLGLEAHRVSDTVEARGSLLFGLLSNPQLSTFLRGHAAPVSSVAFTRDGARLASASADGDLALWDVGARQPLQHFSSGEDGPLPGLAFSPDRRTLAFSSRDKIILWDVSSNRRIEPPLAGHGRSVSSVVFSPSGLLLASASEDGSIILWDVAAKQPIGSPLTGHGAGVLSVAFSEDGEMLASGARDNAVILWEADTGRRLGTALVGHTEPVKSVAFSPDGKALASGSEDGKLRLWDVASGQPLREPLVGHTDQVRNVAFSPDGKTVASAGRDSRIILWDAGSGQPIGEPLTGHTRGVSGLAFNADGRTLVTGSEDGTVILWDVAAGRPLAGHTGTVGSVAFSPDGQTLASGSEDRTIMLWDVAKGRPTGQPLAGHGGGVMSVAFSPSRQLLASGSRDNGLLLWDHAGTPPTARPLEGHTMPVKSVTFSKDGKTLASGSRDNKVLLWDVTTNPPSQRTLEHPEQVFIVAFSRDGTMLASGMRNNKLVLWDVASGQSLGQLEGHKGPVQGLAFSPDGKTLVSGSGDGTLMFWDVAGRQALDQPLIGHTGAVETLAMSPDGTTLASGSADSRVILWDVASRQPLGQPLTGHGNWVTTVAFSDDGKMLASGSRDGTVILRSMSFESWPTRVCSTVARNLTPDEWRQYLGDEPYRKSCPELP
jgi:WD40 repeat protein